MAIYSIFEQIKKDGGFSTFFILKIEGTHETITFLL